MSTAKKRKLTSSDDSDAPSAKKLKQIEKEAKASNTGARKGSNPWGSGESAVSWLLCDDSNIDIKTFMNDYFGIKALKITRNDSEYYSKQSLDLTLNKIKEIGTKYRLCHGIDIVSKYCINDSEDCPEWLNAKQESNLDLEMSESTDEISKILKDGCTMQYHHPQHRYYELMHFIYLLESYFQVLVGSNVYVTPNSTQGLAPHYDDVDVWILQMEGEKHWKLYSHGNENDCQPIDSSGDLNLKMDCPNAKLLMECDLIPGDMLYLPRGTIHCAQAIKNDKCDYSNHLTISTHQRSTVGHFEQLLVNRAMDTMLDDSNIVGRYASHRRTIDSKLFSQIGSSFSNDNDMINDLSNKVIETLIKSNDLQTAMKNVMKDAGDQVYIDFLQHRMPPIHRINYIEGILFGNLENEKIVEKQQKEKASNKMTKSKLNDIMSDSLKVKFISLDWIRFVDSSKHSDLINDDVDSNEMLDNDMISNFINNNNSNCNGEQGFSLLNEINEDSKDCDESISAMKRFESPAIPSRKQHKASTTKSGIKSVKKQESVRIIEVGDSPALVTKGKASKTKSKHSKDSDNEKEDFDIENETTIVNQNFENEFLDDGYNFNNNSDYEMPTEDDEDSLLVFHCLDNDVECHMTEFLGESRSAAAPIILPLNLRPLLDTLFDCFPDMVSIATLLKKANESEKVNDTVFTMDDVKLVVTCLSSHDVIQIEL